MKLRHTILLAACVAGVSPLHAAEREPLRLGQTIEMPDVEGRIDHLTVDVKAKRLFVAALGNNTVEIIDLALGKRTASIAGVKEPQGVRYVAEGGRLFVACGEDGSCAVFDGATLKQVGTIRLGGDADNVRYDPQARRVYVGYGQGAIGVIDAVKHSKITDIKLKAHPESFQLESKGNRMFVNVPRAMEIAVIDRSQDAVIATWPIHEAHENFPMALDESHHRLFVGCRKPAKLLVLDSESGKPAASLACSGDTDDVFYDEATQRVYVSCGEGFIDVFERTEADRYSRIQHLATAPGARTSLFVPQLRSFYLAVPRRGLQRAEIRVYKAEQR
jgi:DNA-binding beta-propeller fold protein YncE